MSTELPHPYRLSGEGLTPGERRELTLPGGLKVAFRWIPPGEFWMGDRGGDSDEEPVHRVVIEEGFWLGETPVTQEEFMTWKAGHEFEFPGKPRHPAEQVTWHEARGFCGWLDEECRKELIGSFGGMTPCLPTEAQWEYACRAGSGTQYYNGDGEAALAEVGWYGGNSDNTTHDVGEKKEKHPWGLSCVHGNVWEWCFDPYADDAYQRRWDGMLDTEILSHEVQLAVVDDRDDPQRVLRGGAWSGGPGWCRAAYRYRYGAVDRFRSFGFRVCLVPRGGPSGEGKGGAGVGERSARDERAKRDDGGGFGEGLRRFRER